MVATLVSREDWNQPPSWSLPSRYKSALCSVHQRIKHVKRPENEATKIGKVTVSQGIIYIISVPLLPTFNQEENKPGARVAAEPKSFIGYKPRAG